MEMTAAFDYVNPDYGDIFRERADRLARLRLMSAYEVGALKAYYRDNIPQFIDDWGMTADTRNASRGIPVVMPFKLFPIQREWLDFIYRKWKEDRDGLTEKSRDMGVSWLAMAFSVSMCLFHRNLTIGFGSAKEDKVDRSGDPDSLFYKGRAFLQYLPREFRGDWETKRNSAHMRLLFPSTECAITGEAGDNIGRGGRSAIYFVDEAAHIEHPKLIDASLSANTNCRQDMSSVNGMANSFAEKRWGGKVEVFTMGWRSDPRKDEAWRAKKEESLDPVVWSAEYELDYTSSVEGIIIPSEWVRAAVGLHDKLGIVPTGIRMGSLDVADEGKDKNAFGHRHGPLLLSAKTWSGKGSDLLETTSKAFFLCDELQVREFLYDADGMGGSVRGKAKELNAERTKAGADGRPRSFPISVSAFRGSGAVLYPERIVARTERKNEDYFKNAKAQAWYYLRARFENAWLASQGRKHDADNIIFLDRAIPELTRLLSELSQPVWKPTTTGHLLVDKTPDGMSSPNLADMVMMLFSPRKVVMNISEAVLAATARR